MVIASSAASLSSATGSAGVGSSFFSSVSEAKKGTFMCSAFDLQVAAALDADGAKAVVEEAPARRMAAVERTFIVLIVTRFFTEFFMSTATAGLQLKGAWSGSRAKIHLVTARATLVQNGENAS
eukprot:scaffold24779_cov51-Skeletonema_menzelii.AAC.1